MRFSNSALTVLWSVAGLFFPRPRGVQATSYTAIGTGQCQDCSGNSFDSVDISAQTIEQDCQDSCSECRAYVNGSNSPSPPPELLGFYFEAGTTCTCLFNNVASNAFDANPCTTQGATVAGNYDDTQSGSGEICGVGSGSGTCYSKVDAVPSSQPSSNPSESPSTQPSSMPSSNPSSMPSSMPSESPSETPSSMPSEKPSAMPSESPSDDPSSMPSETPSVMPSESPSDDPSSMPSDQPSVSQAPSDAPSDQPSETPSESPSEEPSSEPSETPSCSPSSSPTQSPSVEVGVNLFYPDWANGGETCRNDGAQPDYMEINPTQWLSSSLDACCKKFFGGFLYKQCIGAYPPDADDCTVMLFYPDWNGENVGCLDDGQEPLYMLGNANYFLSNTREECCEKFYDWNYYPCTGTQPEGSGSYYPDWNGSPVTCKADGNMPDYMLRADSAPWYLFDTLKECCEKYFHYDLNNCMGSSGTPVTGSNKWYVAYDANTCVQDCVGTPTTCGGLVEGSWVETFNTKKACCDAKLWYYPDCIRTNN